MSKFLTESQINKRFKEGRGQGTGSAYIPFIKIHDVSSKGRSHRVYSAKTKRIHHFLSDLELSIFLIFHWLPNVSDIREQFPLTRDDTDRIHQELGIVNKKPGGVSQVLSSDLLIDFNDGSSSIAIQAKYSSDLSKASTVARLMIEKRYWDEKQIPWHIVTEKEIPKNALTNIKWIFNSQSNSDELSELNHYYEVFSHAFKKFSDKKITEIAQSLDICYDLEHGDSMSWLRKLISQQYFVFNINKIYTKIKGSEILHNSFEDINSEYKNVSN